MLADTAVIASAALAGLRAIYKPGYQLAKAGVMLLELQTSTVLQGELELQADSAPGTSSLMTAMDALNHRYGQGTVQLASAGLQGKDRTWSMRQNLLTPQYTTRWDDMPVARA